MINTITLMGRLVRDPELRTTQSGKEVASFTVAVQRSRSKNGETDFIPVVVWDKTAKFVCDYFRKGSMIAVTGSLQTRNYTDGDGYKRTAFEVIACEVSFCGTKEKADESARKIQKDREFIEEMNNSVHEGFSQNADFEYIEEYDEY